ncbi:hypothetical protein NQU17_01075 [Clostridiaceae bacterium HFYG-1003]|nr:hypothetical protein NQU17_01075 [Clostridiaceae bacterium HFYG-1003]
MIYQQNDLAQALSVMESTIRKCEQIQPKFLEGSPQNTLLRNRLKSLALSKDLITCVAEQKETGRYSEDELTQALPPMISIISKCAAAQKKHEIGSRYHLQCQKIIDAMTISIQLIQEEIEKIR